MVRVGRQVRARLTWALVAAVAACGLAGLEAWPLTGWRLFSSRRTPVVVRYEARAVTAVGEAPVPFAALPHAYSGFVPVLERMVDQAAAEREPACRAWAVATSGVLGTPVGEVRVYAVEEDLRDGSRRAALAWTCGRAST